jgi:hypothetical protein
MYLGGDADQLHCFSKTPEWWSPHLALHPQVKYSLKFLGNFSSIFRLILNMFFVNVMQN